MCNAKAGGQSYDGVACGGWQIGGNCTNCTGASVSFGSVISTSSCPGGPPLWTLTYSATNDDYCGCPQKAQPGGGSSDDDDGCASTYGEGFVYVYDFDCDRDCTAYTTADDVYEELYGPRSDWPQPIIDLVDGPPALTMCEACDNVIGPAYDGCECSTPSCTDGMGNWDGCGGNYKSNYDCEQAFGSGWTLN